VDVGPSHRRHIDAGETLVEWQTLRERGYSRSPLSSPMCRRLMPTFPQLSTSKKMHGLMRSRESIAQNDWSGDALQEALLNLLIFTCQHESRAPDTRIGCRRTNA